jgi:hypothetical protein
MFREFVSVYYENYMRGRIRSFFSVKAGGTYSDNSGGLNDAVLKLHFILFCTSLSLSPLTRE